MFRAKPKKNSIEIGEYLSKSMFERCPHQAVSDGSHGSMEYCGKAL